MTSSNLFSPVIKIICLIAAVKVNAAVAGTRLQLELQLAGAGVLVSRDMSGYVWRYVICVCFEGLTCHTMIPDDLWIM